MLRFGHLSRRGDGRRSATLRGMSLPVVAGAISTVIFALSALPMMVKAAHTKDLRSYSLGNILLSNVGNVIQTIYVFHLPMGPIWVLHTFYLVSTALMLFWYVRYAGRHTGVYTELPTPQQRSELVVSPDAATLTAL